MSATESELPITRVTIDEIDALRKIRLEALRYHPTAFSADYDADENRPLEVWQQRVQNSPVFIAWDGKSPAAMAGIFPGQSSKTRHHGTIWGVYVQPSYRGRGLAGRLVDRCVEWAREQSMRVVYIGAIADNTSAIRCYTRCGFSVFGVQPGILFYDGRYYDEVLMALELS